MSNHNLWSFRIRHILDAIERIEGYAKNMSCAEFVSNRLVRDAVERNFEIIGEASGSIPFHIQNKNPQIPCRKMKAMRNFIAHQYDEVEEIAIWNTISDDLPELKIKIKELLKTKDK